MNPVPQSMVASSQRRCPLASPWTEALTASTIVKELVRRNAVIMVALTMLSEWEGGGPPRRRNAPVAVGVKQRAKRQRIGEQKQPHPNFLGVGAEERRLISRRD